MTSYLKIHYLGFQSRPDSAHQEKFHLERTVDLSLILDFWLQGLAVRFGKPVVKLLQLVLDAV